MEYTLISQLLNFILCLFALAAALAALAALAVVALVLARLVLTLCLAAGSGCN